MGKRYDLGQAGRTDMFTYEPEVLKIITDEKHKLYDPREKLPLDEKLVRSAMVYGIKKPIHITHDGDDAVVVDGRQRVKAAVEANKRLRAEGKEPIRVKVLREKGDESDLFGIMVLTNEGHQEDSPLAKAKKAQRLLEMDKTEEEVATLFHVSKKTVQAWSQMMSCSMAVKKAIENHQIPATVALDLSKLSKEDQDKKLEKLIENGPVKGKKAKAIARGESEKPKMRSRDAIEKRLAKYTEAGGPQRAMHELQWVLSLVDDEKRTNGAASEAS